MDEGEDHTDLSAVCYSCEQDITRDSAFGAEWVTEKKKKYTDSDLRKIITKAIDEVRGEWRFSTNSTDISKPEAWFHFADELTRDWDDNGSYTNRYPNIAYGDERLIGKLRRFAKRTARGLRDALATAQATCRDGSGGPHKPSDTTTRDAIISRCANCHELMNRKYAGDVWRTVPV